MTSQLSLRENNLIQQLTTLLPKHVLTSHTVWVKYILIKWKNPYFTWIIATLLYLDSAKFMNFSGYELRLKTTICCGILLLYVQLMGIPLFAPFLGVITAGAMDQEEACHCTQGRLRRYIPIGHLLIASHLGANYLLEL